MSHNSSNLTRTIKFWKSKNISTFITLSYYDMVRCASVSYGLFTRRNKLFPYMVKSTIYSLPFFVWNLFEFGWYKRILCNIIPLILNVALNKREIRPIIFYYLTSCSHLLAVSFFFLFDRVEYNSRLEEKYVNIF